MLWLGPLVVVLAMILAWIGLRMTGFGVPEGIRAFDRALFAHGYIEKQGWLARMEERSPRLRGFIQRSNIEHDLAVVGSPDSPIRFAARSVAYALVALGGFTFLDGLGFFSQGGWIFPPVLALIAAIVVGIFPFIRLRRQARQKGRDIDHSLQAILPIMAAILSVPGVQTNAAINILSMCVDHNHLVDVLHNDRWHEVIPHVPVHSASHIIHQEIGQAYGSKIFVRLGKAIQDVRNTGGNEGEAIAHMAKVSYEEAIQDIEEIVSRAPTKAMIAIAGILLLLISLILVPMFGYVTTL